MSTRDWEIRFTDGDGSPLYTITSSPCSLMTYVPKAPREQIVESKGIDDGTVIRRVRYRNVVETIEIKLQDGSMPNNFDELENIKLLLEQARDAQENMFVDRVYIEVKRNSTDDWWRSEIIGGHAQEKPTTMGITWERDILFATITYTRKYYWEKSSLTTMSLTNQHETNQSQCDIYNHSDGGHDNFVDIDSTEIPGDLPTPLRVDHYNEDASLDFAKCFATLFREDDTLDDFAHAMEAESATIHEGSSQSDGTCSNGNYAALTWSGDADTKLETFAITSTTLGEVRGRWFKILGRFRSAVGASGPKIRWKLAHGDDVVWESGQINLHASERIQDLGNVQLPPGPTRAFPATAPMNLELWGQKTGGGAFDLDFIQFFSEEGVRIYDPVAGSIAQNERLGDNGEDVWKLVPGVPGVAGVIYNYTVTGKAMMALPGSAYRVYFLWMDDDDTAATATKHSIAISVQERRKTL